MTTRTRRKSSDAAAVPDVDEQADTTAEPDDSAATSPSSLPPAPAPRGGGPDTQPAYPPGKEPS